MCWLSSRARNVRRVADCRETTAGHFVGHSRHIAHARGVDPVVVELEERADGNRVVESFVRPPGFENPIDILLTDRRRVVDHFSNEGVERPVLVREWGRVDVGQNTLNEIPISEQLRRDRGVGADSEEALVEFGGQRRDELPLARWERRGAAHHFLCESR